jgi:hypothetical protein
MYASETQLRITPEVPPHSLSMALSAMLTEETVKVLRNSAVVTTSNTTLSREGSIGMPVILCS